MQNGDDFGDPYDGVDDEMRDLLDNLPPEARHKILNGRKLEGEDGSDDEDDDDDESGWGRKKSSYWSADTADLEIGQDIQDAEDEEVAAKDVHAQTLKHMAEKDFFDDVNDSESSADEASKKLLAKRSKSKKNALQSEDLQSLALKNNVRDRANLLFSD
jgi:U3 small nucleolar RNA-associated protein 3